MSTRHRRKKKVKVNTPVVVVLILLILAIITAVVLLINILSHRNNRPDSPPNSTTAGSTAATTEKTTEITTEATTAVYNIDILGKTVSSLDTSLDLNGINVANPNELMDKLASLPNLTHVEMCRCGLSNQQMEGFVAKFPNIKFVWEIDLKEHGSIRTDRTVFCTLNNGTTTYRLTDADAAVFKYCTDMRILDLGHNSITDYSFLQYMPELRVLIIADNLNPPDPNTYRITNISALASCKNLRYLEIFLNQITDISALSGLDNLVDLNICYNPISNIEPLMNKPKLERLYMKSTNITAADYNKLKAAYPNTQIVYVGEYGSTGDGWREDANGVKHVRYALMRELIEEIHGEITCDKNIPIDDKFLENHNFYEIFK